MRQLKPRIFFFLIKDNTYMKVKENETRRCLIFGLFFLDFSGGLLSYISDTKDRIQATDYFLKIFGSR